jgi:CDGSH-type Zn-finger protein|tara:strand:- start:24612 stop:24791 length:180 start_codon:yes stop_codon:yes gene_type:complete|eukprot:COSAG04_NODE_1710_length_5848_cov_2.592451_9_plen_60_part_00
MAVEINIMENGPILVKGETTVTKGGKKVTVSENYALCRCGKSKSQPMCDGTHKSEKFKG